MEKENLTKKVEEAETALNILSEAYVQELKAEIKNSKKIEYLPKIEEPGYYNLQKLKESYGSKIFYSNGDYIGMVFPFTRNAFLQPVKKNLKTVSRAVKKILEKRGYDVQYKSLNKLLPFR